MIVGASTWLDKEIEEVEIIVADEKYEINCLSKNKKVGVQSYEIR